MNLLFQPKGEISYCFAICVRRFLVEFIPIKAGLGMTVKQKLK